MRFRISKKDFLIVERYLGARFLVTKLNEREINAMIYTFLIAI
jgi:hypothetical protein